MESASTQQAMATLREWIIGASPNVDIVVDQPAVSSRHCRLIQTEWGFTIEDLNSTNGTFVNDERINSPRDVSPKDRVTLGSRIPLPWPNVTASAAPRSATAGDAGGVKSSFPLAAIVGATIVVLALVLTPMFWRSPEEPQAQQQPSPVSQQSEPQHLAGPPLSRAVYSIVVKNEATGLVLGPIGNAFAVSEKHVVTSANMALVLEQALEEHPTAVIHCPASGEEYTLNPASVQVHPKFRSAYKTFTTASGERAALFEKLEDRENPPTKEEVQAIEEELIDADWRFVEAAERMTYYDLAVIQAAESLPAWLPIVSVDAKLNTQIPVSLWGYAGSADEDQELYRFSGGREPRKVAGELEKLPVFKQGSRLFRLSVACQGLDIRQTWFGSPALNADRQVIGVFSNWSVDLQKPNSSPTGESFEAAWIGLLQEVAPRVWLSIQNSESSGPS